MILNPNALLVAVHEISYTAGSLQDSCDVVTNRTRKMDSGAGYFIDTILRWDDGMFSSDSQTSCRFALKVTVNGIEHCSRESIRCPRFPDFDIYVRWGDTCDDKRPLPVCGNSSAGRQELLTGIQICHDIIPHKRLLLCQLAFR